MASTRGLPTVLTKRISPEDMAVVVCWWQTLTSSEQASLLPTRARLEARFLEPGAEDVDEGATDFYEYLVGHELAFVERVFHICSAHADARAAVAARHIPASFTCPFMRDDAECPMRTLLAAAGGRDVRLELVEAPR